MSANTYSTLGEFFPELAAELTALLKCSNRSDLSNQIIDLKIVDRCRCGDDFCAAIYTVPRPLSKVLGSPQCIELEPAEGMIILDACNGQITGIEVLFRDEIRKKLLELLP
jgi:hypothetical protein